MRDPFTWSFPIGRLFGILVRIHVLFPIFVLAMVLRESGDKDALAGTWQDALMLMGLLFLVVLLHEFGHCFAARRHDGEAREILLWPLGGLASVDIPHSPWAHFWVAFAGPLVNLAVCLVCALALAFAFQAPIQAPLNPFWYPYRLPLGESGSILLTTWDGGNFITNHLGVVVLARLFYVSWILFLFNMILVGFPMDAGRMFQSVLWPHFGYRQATLYAVFAGFGVMFLLILASIVAKEVLYLLLAFFIYTSCKQEWLVLESGGEESLFGYDFSQGYTSLEKDHALEPQPRRKKQNFIQRWLQKRAARKLQREQERQEAEELRMDELLEKIQRQGKDSLTDEEQRFLKRVSDRYRNRN